MSSVLAAALHNCTKHMKDEIRLKKLHISSYTNSLSNLSKLHCLLKQDVKWRGLVCMTTWEGWGGGRGGSVSQTGNSSPSKLQI